MKKTTSKTRTVEVTETLATWIEARAKESKQTPSAFVNDLLRTLKARSPSK